MVSFTEQRRKACRSLLGFLFYGVLKGNLENGTFQGSKTKHLESYGITLGNKIANNGLFV